MTYKDFISILKEVKYISRIENGYSHIVCELLYNQVLNPKEYMIVDTSTYHKRNNRPLIIDHLCAVPDFVITNKTLDLSEVKRFGCIEIKYYDDDVKAHLLKRQSNRLITYYKQKGYLETYNSHVIYTNGWKWNYYTVNPKAPSKTFDFTVETNQNPDYFRNLIDFLSTIDWKNKPNNV